MEIVILRVNNQILRSLASECDKCWNNRLSRLELEAGLGFSHGAALSASRYEFSRSFFLRTTRNWKIVKMGKSARGANIVEISKKTTGEKESRYRISRVRKILSRAYIL